MNSIFNKFIKPIFFLLICLLKPPIRLICIPLYLLQAITPFDRLVAKLTGQEKALDHLASEAASLLGDRRISKGDALLINDERKAFAELVAPSAIYPSMYRDVPADLARSIVSDGRTVNGHAPAAALAGISLTGEFVIDAWENATKFAVRTAYITLVLSLVAAYLTSSFASNSIFRSMPQSSSIVSRGDGPADIAFLAKNYADVWTAKEGEALAAKVNVEDHSQERAQSTAARTASITLALLMFVLLALSGAVLAAVMARLVWLGRFRFLVFAAADQGVAGLRHSWREALQRWRWRLPDREMELATWNDQVNFATEIDKSPLLDIGTSLGVLEHRGHLLAPQQGTPVRMSVVDMLQHIDVLGGSGEGKSRNFYIPLVKQLLTLRKSGYPIALYATDDKGAIGVDILEAAREVGLPADDILVIGTGPGEWRVDLLDGLTPVEVADIIKSVAKQAGGESGDDFWPEMASDLLLQVAVVLYAAEHTQAGEEWNAKNGIRMYSLLNILRVASDDTEIKYALEVVLAALQDKDDQYQSIAHLDKNGLKSSISYLIGNWINMVDATKDGIRANARKALRSFAFKDEIAAGFADGAGDKLLPASQLISNKVKIVNISQIEHGSAGRMVAIMLKTLLFKQARQAEQRDPLFAKARLSWWFDPKLGADAEKYAINVFLADEYQGLVTSSRDDGLSDATVWNVLRSAGVAGVLLSQSVSAYRNAIGDKPTDNMRRNWRTKIILRTEDLATIEEAKKLAGKTMRFQSMEWAHMESAVAVRRETGVSAESLEPVLWSPEFERLPFFELFTTNGKTGKFGFAGYNEAFDVDQRFMLFGDSETTNSSKQAAFWRQEDRTMGIMQHGSSHTESVQDEDLMQMGRARALVFVQRAGGTRVEIVKLGG